MAFKPKYPKLFKHELPGEATCYYARALAKATWLCEGHGREDANLKQWVQDMADTVCIVPGPKNCKQNIDDCLSLLFAAGRSYTARDRVQWATNIAFSVLQDVHYGQDQGRQYADILADIWFREVTPGFLKLDLRGPEIIKLTPYTPADCSFF